MFKQEEISEILYKEFTKKFRSKRAFARDAEVTEATIRRFFLNKQNISLEIFCKLCDSLEIQPSDVLSKVGL